MSNSEDELENILEQSINEAWEGRKLWLDLAERYKLGDGDYVVLMPSDDRDCNYYSLLYLDEFLNRIRGKRAYILTWDDCVKRNAAHFSDRIGEVIDFPRRSAELLMRFYSLYSFTDKLIIASLDEPDGRSGRKLIGRKGLTVEEIVAIGIYGLRKLDRQPDREFN